jgi:hypothetical protein
MAQLQIKFLFLIISLAGCGTNMSKYDSPKYNVVLTKENYQIRDYQPALVAQTKMTSEDTGFRKIFNFISGENSSKESISMTVPVRVSESNQVMGFFMPDNYNISSIPRPMDQSVEIVEFAGGFYGAARFSGSTNPEKVNQIKSELTQWVKKEGYQTTNSWFLDRYDPPWTLWFNRTNEVLIKLERINFERSEK